MLSRKQKRTAKAIIFLLNPLAFILSLILSVEDVVVWCNRNTQETHNYFKMSIRYIMWRVYSIKSSNPRFLIPWYNSYFYALPKDYMCRNIFIKGWYENEDIEFLHNYLKNRDDPVFIDVGANFGLYSLALYRDCRTILAIEPSSREYHRLTNNLSYNGIHNVLTIPKAASNITDFPVKLLIAQDELAGQNAIGRFYYSNTKQKDIEEVDTTTIDYLVDSYNLKKVDTIKIDTDGHELQVLEGSKQTIKRFKPLLLIELPTPEVFEFLRLQRYQHIQNVNSENIIARYV